MKNPTQEIDAKGGESTATAETSTGLDENVAGALSYLLGLLTGILFYVIDDRKFVKFHAAQCIVLAGVLFVVYTVLSIFQIFLTAMLFSGNSGGFILGSMISLVLGLVWLVLVVGGFGLWIYLMVSAYQGKTPRIPVVAGIADKLA